jgi:(1->4)-alpha-D-glucan 1-alpha-D-glucosylmutase
MAFQCAKDNRTDIDPMLFDFMRDLMELKVRGKLESEFVYRFQQFTSPVMAKGVEDTAFYNYNRLTAMNEVGGDPACDGFSLEHFHDYNVHVQAHTPGTMVTLSTHDTKRSDDVRARLAVLTEAPDAFIDVAERWSERNAGLRQGELVDRGTEWFLFQSLTGAWPITAERLKNYMQKAMREAKVRTTWVANNGEYENAVAAYIDGIFADPELMTEVESFVADVADAGRINSLTQTLLKHVVPGVPDLYQGGEIWDFSMVDPDNRRPVDYKQLAEMLKKLAKLDSAKVMAGMEEGLPKLWVIHKALTLRDEHPAWFGAEAAYTPLEVQGPAADRVIACQRGEHVIAIAPRWSYRASGWDGTTVSFAAGKWRNRLTGKETKGGDIALGDLLNEFPVALLVREDAL